MNPYVRENLSEKTVWHMIEFHVTPIFFLNFKFLPFLAFHHAQKGTTFQFNVFDLKMHALKE